MAVSGVNLRRLFGNTNRKVRKNAGVKRGPRKARMIGPSNVVIVNSGGMASVVAAPGPKKTRGRTYGPMFVGPLRPQNTRRNRKVRANKGAKRGPRTAGGVNRMLRRKYF